ncbi:MAG TPA: dethiobiotin synthase [Acidimicrobiales bacterium]|nr:dethiobiotin synthase [Acidimicrobiales bacterium]
MTGARPRRVVLVGGTGTEVGKTWVAARLLETWRAQGLTVAARKPAQSFAPGSGPTDAQVLGLASEEPPEVVCRPERSYPVALAPPMAARLLGRRPVLVDELAHELCWPDDAIDVGLVESAGGLRSPQADDGDTLDLAARLGADVLLVVADAGLGTISAVRLCADSLERRGWAGVVVLNHYDEADPLHVANLDWLRRVDGLDVWPAAKATWEHLATRLAAHPGAPRS